MQWKDNAMMGRSTSSFNTVYNTYIYTDIFCLTKIGGRSNRIDTGRCYRNNTDDTPTDLESEKSERLQQEIHSS